MQISIALILSLVAPAFATSVDISAHCSKPNVRFVTIDLPLETAAGSDGKGIADCNDGKCLLDKASYEGCARDGKHVDILAKVTIPRQGGYKYATLNTAYLTSTGDMKAYDGVNFFVKGMLDADAKAVVTEWTATDAKLVLTVPRNQYTGTLKTTIEGDLNLESDNKIKHVFIENGAEIGLPVIDTTKMEKVTILTTLTGVDQAALANANPNFKVASYDPESKKLTDGFSKSLDICTS